MTYKRIIVKNERGAITMLFKILKKYFSVSFFVFVLSGCNIIENNSPIEETTETEMSTDIIYETKQVESETESEDDLEESFAIGDDIPVSRALAAKMIGAAFNSKEQINSAAESITFPDVDKEKWYYKFVNIVCSQKYMSGAENGTKFLPDEYLSVLQAQYLADNMDKNNKIKIKIDGENRDKPISYGLWTEIYIRILKNLSGDGNIASKFGLSAKKAVVLGVHKNNSLIKENYVITDIGLFKCSGIDLDEYIDMKISFWEKENEIIALSKVVERNPIIYNAYISEFTGDRVVMFSGGAERTFEKSENVRIENAENEGCIADVKIKNGKIEKLEFIGDISEKQIVDFSGNKINASDSSVFETDSDIKIYNIENGKAMWKTSSDIISGKTYKLYLKNGRVCAIICDI